MSEDAIERHRYVKKRLWCNETRIDFGVCNEIVTPASS
ncbi:hypothetical protein PAMC26577_39610 [Caballeronia sordidicola]|uniref:Uncharacterized protein n=1 Tax=Caballeronia sordidicola TaxID=196367 RepID=A0A242M329_CABSO|nr:hypothetical protein PAMC26577_39610 [Caballeronia sordidicola]